MMARRGIAATCLIALASSNAFLQHATKALRLHDQFASSPRLCAASSAAASGAPSRSSVSAPPMHLTEDEASFTAWLSAELALAPNYEAYSDVYAEATQCVLRWRQRYRGNPKLWRSLMRGERVVKEIIEAAPVIAAARAIVDATPLAPGEKLTIVDLCSGASPPSVHARLPCHHGLPCHHRLP